MSGYSRYIFNQVIRVVEKIPGVNLNQVLLHNEVYFVISPKSGSRTIRDSFLNEISADMGSEWRYIRYLSKRGLRKLSLNESVVYVYRDPIERIHSCWKQKVGPYRDRQILPYFFLYYPLIRKDMEFIDFLRAIKNLPGWLCEKHFRPDSVTIDFERSSLIKVDISELSSYLGISDNHRSNKTANVSISAESFDFFQKNLADRYAVEHGYF